MKKSEFVEKLKRTIKMSTARSESNSLNSEDQLNVLVSDILETLEVNGVKPPKWMERIPMTMADGSVRMRDLRWRFSWEAEFTEPNRLLDGPGEVEETFEGESE